MDLIYIVILAIIVESYILSFKTNGFLPWLIDFTHLFITFLVTGLTMFIVYEIVVLRKYDIVKLLFVNIFFLFMVLGVVFYGMCPLTIIYNKLTDQPVCTPFLWKIADRFDKQQLDTKVKYYTTDNDGCQKNTKAWLSGQVYSVLTITALNVLFFIKYINGKDRG